MKRAVFGAFIIGACLVALALVGCGGGSSTSPTPVGVAPPTTTTTTLPPAPLWTLSGHGNSVFDMPRSVARVHVVGVWSGRSTSNFIVWIGGRLVINEILRGTANNTYDGIHLTNGGGVTQIENSNDITWSFEEIRQ